MQIEFTAKQKILMASDYDTTVYGGARGGGKTFSVSGCKSIMHVREEYLSDEVDANGWNMDGFRSYYREDLNQTVFYKFSIDYPDFICVIVRKTERQLYATIDPECRKIFPQPEFGGVFNVSQQAWTFPSGARVIYKSCEKESALEFFKSGNYTMLIIEELTEFQKEWVEIMEAGCRSSNENLKALKIYTTNPGGKGHRWVKDKFVQPCLPKPDGPPVYLEKYKLTYQPLRPNAPGKTKTGETFLFIPSLIFDNPYLMDNDEAYVRNLMGKNETLRQMWLFGNWDVIAGQFFDMFEWSTHVRSEYEFFGAKEGDVADLFYRKERFDWGNYRLFRGYDYGYAVTSAWALVALAVHKYSGDMVVFHTIKMPKLTARMQAREANTQFRNFYNLSPENFERECADPKSFWQNIDTGDHFKTPWDYYAEEGICLQPANNDRLNGAMAMLEVMRIREDGTPQLTILDNNIDFIDDLANVPIDPKNPNDVDTKSDDHFYDAIRYPVYGIKEDFSYPEDKQRKSWRDDMQDMYDEEHESAGDWMTV